MSVPAWADSVWRRGIRPEPVLSVSAWADRYRRLSGKDSAEPGPWRTSRTPYLREIMDALSVHHPAETVVVMAGAQLGKSSAGLNWIGYVIHHAPGPMLCVQPTAEMAKRFSRQRLDPLVEHSPALRDLVAEPRARDSQNTMLAKEFPGGTLILTGANSPTGLRAAPIRYLFLDEVDGYPADAAGEGDPVALAMRRTETFSRRKVLMTSTPTLQGFSRIEAAYQESDRRQYLVPCPHCGDAAPLTWARIRWPKGKPRQAHMVCEACGGVIDERDKPALIAGGRWVATAQGDGRTVGFHLPALVSPWRRWADIAAEHAAVCKDPPRLQVWTNTVLAETWADRAGEPVGSVDALMSRREDWGSFLPAAVRVLTAGVDVQGDRLELQVLGWGRDEASWVVDYRVLHGDPSGSRVWAELDRALGTGYRSAGGLPLEIRAACVDTGGIHTRAAYEYCRSRWSRSIWAIKGRGGTGVPAWPIRASRSKARTPMFTIGVDALKDALFARLRLTEGPVIHFSGRLDRVYFEQLTSERVVTKYDRGRPVRSWQMVKPDAANEALDTMVYAMAALEGLKLMRGLRLDQGQRPARPLPGTIRSQELWPEVGDGTNRGWRIVAVTSRPHLPGRSDTPCPRIAFSPCVSQGSSRIR